MRPFIGIFAAAMLALAPLAAQAADTFLLMGVGSPPASPPPTGGPQTVASLATTATWATSPITATATSACPAGAVAVAAVVASTHAVTGFSDNTGSGAWTQIGTVGVHASLAMYKRIVPAGGFTTSTVFSAAFSGVNVARSAVEVDCFADGVSVASTADVTAFPAGETIGSSSSMTPAPAAATSYVWAVFSSTNIQSAGNTAPANGWNYWKTLNDSGSGMNIYWRQYSDTTGVAISNAYSGTGYYVQGWAEIGK